MGWADADVKTTMIYTHVLNRSGRGVVSPSTEWAWREARLHERGAGEPRKACIGLRSGRPRMSADLAAGLASSAALAIGVGRPVRRLEC